MPLRFVWAAAAALELLSASTLPAMQPASSCQDQVFEGEVRYGQPFRHSIGGGLELLLDPLPSGWLLRVLPEGKPRPPHDAAELATPPYQSMTPLAISTDYSFRSQDAIGWNPRHFRFASNPALFAQMLSAYDRYMKTAPGAERRQAEQRLTALVQRSADGVLEILDSRLMPGTADQAGLAASVASHFQTTAHTVEPAAEGLSSLGRITWLRFRIRLTPSGDKRCAALPVAKSKQRIH